MRVIGSAAMGYSHGRVLVVLAALSTSTSSAKADDRPPALAALMLRTRAAATSHSVDALARLVDREFTTGEEQDRRASLDELRRHPLLLDDLRLIVDRGTCHVDRDLAQCEVAVGPVRRARAVFLRGSTGWRLSAFIPGHD